MRVAYVCTDAGVPVWGTKGCSVHVQEMLRALTNQGCAVDLFARRIGGTPPADLAEVRLFRLPRPDRNVAVRAREQFLFAQDRHLRLELEKHAPYDFIYERHALWSAAAMEYAGEASIPSALEVNAPLVEEQRRHREIVALDAALRVVARSVSKARLLVAVSTAVSDYLRSFSVSGDRILVVGNGVNVDRFAAARDTIRERWLARATGETQRPITIGFAGTLRPWHGMSVLGRAFQQFHVQHPHSMLLVIGDGPARGELEAALGETALRATTLTGKVAPCEVPKFLADCDIAAAPYPKPAADQAPFYFSPLKLFEYMACGLPIVASRLGDIPRVIVDGANGHLVEPGDARAMADSWRRLASRPQTALEVGTAAATTVTRDHTWQSVLDKILNRVGITPAPAATARSAG